MPNVTLPVFAFVYKKYLHYDNYFGFMLYACA